MRKSNHCRIVVKIGENAKKRTRAFATEHQKNRPTRMRRPSESNGKKGAAAWKRMETSLKSRQALLTAIFLAFRHTVLMATKAC